MLGFTYHPTAPLPFADDVVRIPAPAAPDTRQPQSPAGEGQARMAAAVAPGSTLLLGSAYEAALGLLPDCVGVMLAAERGGTDAVLRQRHTKP